jgi:hypothetical protein
MHSLGDMFGSAGIGHPSPETRLAYRPTSGHFCRIAGLVAAICLGACSTTHDLGRVGDPGTTARIDALAARRGTTAEVVPLPGPGRLAPSYAVTAAAPDGLMVSVGGAPPKLISYSQVRSLGTVDRLRGARNGALLAVVPSFVAGFFLGSALAGVPACGAGCTAADDSRTAGLKVGAVGALVGAAIGGAIGALVGCRDRYVIETTETASAQ